MIHKALSGQTKEEILFGSHFPAGWSEALHPKIQAIADGAYQDKAEDEVRGSGYVVESLEAALWCFLHTDSFRDAVPKAVNLGDDADTTGAVCGQIAGPYYGVEGIPEEWLGKLAMRERIAELASSLIGK